MSHTALPLEQESWTIDDLARRPDDGRRYEIVDGQLVVMSRVSMAHQVAAQRLGRILSEVSGDEFLVLENVAVNIAPTWRIPDLTVFRASAYVATGLDLAPADIALAVEIVSPGSRTNDRITKPAEYAVAGIPAYWRLEITADLSLTAYSLEPGASTYTEIGTWVEGEVAVLDDPVSVSVEISALTP